MQNKNIKGGLFLFIKILGVPLFVLAGFFIFGHSVRAIDISDDVTWTKAQSPVIIKERVWVMPGATLTIEAGVAVKLYPNQFNISLNFFFPFRLCNQSSYKLV